MTNPEKEGCILVINMGSSSVKFQLFSNKTSLEEYARGSVSDIGGTPLFSASIEENGYKEAATEIKLPQGATHEEALYSILNWIETHHRNWEISAVAHRVVHGGEHYKTSVRVTPDVMEKLRKLCPFVPLHQPHNLAGIDIMNKLKPTIPQIACFDTAFHANHHALFKEYALPKAMREKGIRRYGFHGLSFEWMVHTLSQKEPELAKSRIVAAHLGNGSSLCAIRDKVSVDTTMGFTAVDGLPMGTRCGQLDPCAVIYMIRDLGLSPDEVESMLYRESGLKGLSEWTNDVKLLEESDAPRARFAMDFLCLKIAQIMGMMAAAIGGVDAVVFTGGIGEHSDYVRTQVLDKIAFLKPFEVRVIEANEERMMAMHAEAILRQH